MDPRAFNPPCSQSNRLWTVKVPWSFQRCGFTGARNAIRDQYKPNKRRVSLFLL